MRRFHGELDLGSPGRVWALAVPADPEEVCCVVSISQTAAAISAAIGGGLIDDEVCAVHARERRVGRFPAGGEPAGEAAREVARQSDREEHTVYQDANRDQLGLPDNSRAKTLARRLNWPHCAQGISLRGTILVTGLDPTGCDTHVPNSVLVAAAGEGLIGSLSIVAGLLCEC